MATKKKQDEPLSLADTLAKLREEGNEVGSFSEFPTAQPRGLTTGNLTLDTLTGIGGFPTGRITELYGPYSSGKTTSALQCAAKVQQNGGNVVFLDYERSLDPVYCKALGLDTDADSFIYVRPKHFEHGVNVLRKLLGTGQVQLGVADSVAAMTTENELTADTGKVLVADRAKMMYQTCRQLIPLLSQTDAGMIFLNHLLEKVDATFMGQQLAAKGIKQWVTPGGKALGFYSSLRVEFKPIGNEKSDVFDPLTNEVDKQVRQTNVRATVIKNKVADPFRTAELRVRFGHGFSQEFSVLNVLLAHGMVKVKTGGWHTFPLELRTDDDQTQIQGEDNVLSTMERDPEWMRVLTDAAYKVVESHDVFKGDPVPDETAEEV